MFGLLYTVYPNCTFISVNMYITAQNNRLDFIKSTGKSGYPER